MGRTKQLVNWPTADGPKPLVAAAYDAIRAICDEMVVVVGHEADAVAAALGDRPFHRCSSDPDAPMFESIRAGLRSCPVDRFRRRRWCCNRAIIRKLQPNTLTALTDWSLKRPVQAVIPRIRGRGGHPVLIPPPLSMILLAADCPTGLG